MSVGVGGTRVIWDALLALEANVFCNGLLAEFLLLLFLTSAEGMAIDSNLSVLLLSGSNCAFDLLLGRSSGASSRCAFEDGVGFGLCLRFCSSSSLTCFGTTSMTVPQPGCGALFFFYF